MLQELCEANPGWETVVLAEDRGIFIGSQHDLKLLLANTSIEEE
jgi:hypothetical protein